MADIKYLDLTGLQKYDQLIKAYSDAGDSTLSGRIDDLETAVGNGGSIDERIEDAIDDLKGTLGQGDAATLEAINDELDGLDSAIATLNGSVTDAGSVAKAVKDGIDALDGGTIELTQKQPVTSVSQANGLVSASTGNIDAQYVDVTWTGENPVSTTTTVQGSLNEIYSLINSTGEAGAVTVEKNGTVVNAIHADGSDYVIKQGTNTVATLNIAADMVVSSGSVVTADGNETDVPTGTTLTVGQKYVRLVIANSEDGKNIYIPVNELYDDYSFTDGDEIDFTESGNVVSAAINTGSIAESKLTTALQNKINSAATVVNPKSTGHVTVSVTAASGATPAQVTIAENDIASAADLTTEVSRATAAEGEIASLVGLTGNEGARAYSTNIGKANVVADMNEIDSRLDALEGVTHIAITNAEIGELFA